MYRPRVIPCLLLQGKGLVKTVKFKNPTYIGDPMNAIKIFNDLEADELVFLDIKASAENRIPSIELIRQISHEAFMPFAVGGGIKTIDEVKSIIGAGAEKVVINKSAIQKPDLVKQIAEKFGNQSLVISVDVKKNFWGKEKVYIQNGSEAQDIDLIEHVQNMESLGAGEILINSIEHDGVMEGYHTELIKKVAAAVSIPVIAIGGAGKTEHFVKAIEQGASAVAAGAMFVFHGPRRAVLINYPSGSELKSLFY